MVTIQVGDVRPGKCFTTKVDGKVRRVLSTKEGVVAFEVRRGGGSRVDWGGRSEMDVAAFVAEAAREVGCDHTP